MHVVLSAYDFSVSCYSYLKAMLLKTMINHLERPEDGTGRLSCISEAAL
jgi:hypothetical protein